LPTNNAESYKFLIQFTPQCLTFIKIVKICLPGLNSIMNPRFAKRSQTFGSYCK